MILVIGYGNTLRSDDALGPVAAQQLGVRLRDRDADVQVTICHQLTPELVVPVRDARTVVFIDAAVGALPGSILYRRIVPRVLTTTLNHVVSPDLLVGSALHLYGVHVRGLLFTVTGENFELGETLSPPAAAALPKVVDLAEDLIRTLLTTV